MKQDYPKVAVDLAIFSIIEDQLCVALIQMKKKPLENMWAFPGGLVGLDESLDAAAKRELKEAGISKMYLEQLYTAGEVKRDPLQRVVSVVYFALVHNEKVSLKSTLRYNDIRWFPIKKIPPLAYDHSRMAKIAHERLKGKLTYTNIIYNLLPDFFTLSELQHTYEVILDQASDKRNFRKKVLSLNILNATKKHRAEGAHRPALLYKFKHRKPEIVEIT